MAKGAYVGIGSKYTGVTYIESNAGSAYINTGVTPTQNYLRILIRYAYTGKMSAASIFGSEDRRTGITNKYSIAAYGDIVTFYVGNTDAVTSMGSAGTVTIYTLDVTANNGALTVNRDGTVKTGTYSGSVANNIPLALFANNIIDASGNSAVSQYCVARVYSCQIWTGSASSPVLVRDFVAVKNAVGVPMLYDKVTNQQYPSANNASFTAGSEDGNIYEPPGAARKIKKIYVGVNGVAKELKKAYVGVNGVSRLWWGSGPLAPAYLRQTQFSTGTAGAVQYPGAASAKDEWAIFVGGQSDSGTTNFVRAFDDTGTQSSPYEAYTGTVTLASGGSVGKYAVFAGGQSLIYNVWTTSTSVQAWDNTLVKATSTVLPTAVHSMAAARAGFNSAFLIFIGGLNSSGSNVNTGAAYDENLTQTTTTKNYGYLGGAACNNSYSLFYPCRNSAMSSVVTFDSSLMMNTVYGTVTALNSMAAASTANYAIFAGGRSVSNYTPTSNTEVYDNNLVKTTLTPLDSARQGLMGTALGDNAIFYGGDTSNYGGDYTKSSVVEYYDADLVHHTLVGSGLARMNGAAAHTTNLAFFGGGQLAGGSMTDLVDIYKLQS